MTTPRSLPTATWKAAAGAPVCQAALGTCTSATGRGGERAGQDGESIVSHVRNAPQPACEPQAGNVDPLTHAARSAAGARRADPAAGDRLARWLAQGRRIMEADHA